MASAQSGTLGRLRLFGLTLAPAQVWGGIRLVPLLRPNTPGDLRLGLRRYRADETYVLLDGKDPFDSPQTVYWSYIPHAFVLRWSDAGDPVAAYGTHVSGRDGKHYDFHDHGVQVVHRMAKREGSDQLRFLPLHVAMEGFLALHFGGPSIAWTEYSRQAMTSGLSPRTESSIWGRDLAGLDQALRVFELHDDQVGVLVYVAGALASAFVVPHPDDYRALHWTLIEDFYGELIAWYGQVGLADPLMWTSFDDGRVSNLADLGRELGRVEREWGQLHSRMADGLLGEPVRCIPAYECGPFDMIRFLNEPIPKRECHLGEVILRREDGAIEYLRTYRLSESQIRRAYLLGALARESWNLDAAAKRLAQSTAELISRLERAGFGYLLNPEVLARARGQSS